MKKYLLPQNGKLYKANLHCHTKVSDGRNTPAEMKEYYKSRGYQVLAITDHELLVDHTDLDDNGFITLTGYEYKRTMNLIHKKELILTNISAQWSLISLQETSTMRLTSVLTVTT